MLRQLLELEVDHQRWWSLRKPMLGLVVDHYATMSVFDFPHEHHGNLLSDSRDLSLGVGICADVHNSDTEGAGICARASWWWGSLWRDGLCDSLREWRCLDRRSESEESERIPHIEVDNTMRGRRCEVWEERNKVLCRLANVPSAGWSKGKNVC